MASTVKTTNPRRTSARSPPPRAVSSGSVEKGTVLLRNPLPKYTFEKKYSQEKQQSTNKKDKSEDSDATTSVKGQANISDLKLATATGSQEYVTSPISSSPANSDARIGRLVNSFPQAMVSPDFVQPEDLSKEKSKTELLKVEKPVNKVDPFSSSDNRKLKHSVSEPAIEQHPVQSTELPEHSAHNESANSVSQSTQDLQVTNLTSYKDKIQHLEEEKQLLKNQLDVQLQVNQELKKLLVASVGEDLHGRVERLMTERAQLSLELGDFSKKMTEDYEHLDKISIQADMWRSKYMACRVMSDELASAKAFYSMQFQESQMSLQQLLSERHEVRANLYEAYRGLQQIQEAFDPLNTQSSSMKTLASKHIIDLARVNQQLVDQIKYRLLPSHVTASLGNRMEPDWHDYLTQAEAHAQELLSRELRPEDFRCLSKTAIMAPGCMAVDRYHPFTNYDNLTLNVCCKCKGDIRVV